MDTAGCTFPVGGDQHKARIFGVAEIGGVGYEDLIDDVVKRRHQQGNNAGNSIFAHERSRLFRNKKLIGTNN